MGNHFIKMLSNITSVSRAIATTIIIVCDSVGKRGEVIITQGVIPNHLHSTVTSG